MNKKEFKELDREQMIIAFNQLKDDYSVLFDKLEQEKNKINTIKKIMSIGDITDEALFTLVQTTMAELERLEGVEEQLDEEKEKNKVFHKFIMFTGGKDIKDFSATEYMRIRQEGYIDGRAYEQQKAEEIIMKNYISKDKIKEKIVEIINSSSRYNVLCKINENEETRRTRYVVAVLKELLEGK